MLLIADDTEAGFHISLELTAHIGRRDSLDQCAFQVSCQIITAKFAGSLFCLIVFPIFV